MSRGRTCQEKTSNGNVFDSLERAWWVADRLPRGRTIAATVYTCPVCGRYHIGRPSISEQRRKLKGRRA